MNTNKLTNSIIQISIIMVVSLLIVWATWQIGMSEAVEQAFTVAEAESAESGEGWIGGFVEVFIKLAFSIGIVLLIQRVRGSKKAAASSVK